MCFADHSTEKTNCQRCWTLSKRKTMQEHTMALHRDEGHALVSSALPKQSQRLRHHSQGAIYSRLETDDMVKHSPVRPGQVMQGKGGRGLNGEGGSVPGARAETRLNSEAVCWTAHSMLTATSHLAALEDGNASRGHWAYITGGHREGRVGSRVDGAALLLAHPLLGQWTHVGQKG